MGNRSPATRGLNSEVPVFLKGKKNPEARASVMPLRGINGPHPFHLCSTKLLFGPCGFKMVCALGERMVGTGMLDVRQEAVVRVEGMDLRSRKAQ